MEDVDITIPPENKMDDLLKVREEWSQSACAARERKRERERERERERARKIKDRGKERGKLRSKV